MAVFYLDTSAAVKRYMTEKGTDVVTELYAGPRGEHPLCTSHFTALEIESAAVRLHRGGQLKQPAYEALLAGFGRDLQDRLNLLLVDSRTLAEASKAIRKHGLRAPDAIQLACALYAAARIGDGLVVVASDRQLVGACRAEGVDCLDPEAQDSMEKLRGYRQK